MSDYGKVPDKILVSPSDSALTSSIWWKTLPDGAIKPLVTLTKQYKTPYGKTGYKFKAWFEEDLLVLIELILVTLKDVRPETPLPSDLEQYLVSLQEKRSKE